MPRRPALARPIATSLAALVVATAACAGPPRRVALVRPVAPARQEPDLAVEPAVLVEQVVKAHNEARAERKLPALRVDAKLTAAAERHARDMAARGKMDHTGGDGTSPMDRIREAGFRYRRAGENVAFGRFTTDELMTVWLESPPHRKNILGGYSQIGVAREVAEDGTPYWCVTFGLPLRR